MKEEKSNNKPNKEEKLPQEKLNNTDENKTSSSNKNKEKDNCSFGEKIEDTLDNVMGGIQDFFYGQGDDFTNDIPATMDHPSEIRRINKVQTRRNFNKRFIFNKKFLKGLLIFVGLIGLIAIIVSLITFVAV